jgi:hypothetical protein
MEARKLSDKPALDRHALEVRRTGPSSTSRGYMESWWINNLRATAYTDRFNQSAPGGGAASDNQQPWATRKTDPSVHRHQMGTVVTYADGHTKWRSGMAITSGEDWMDGRTATEGLFVRNY